MQVPVPLSSSFVPVHTLFSGVSLDTVRTALTAEIPSKLLCRSGIMRKTTVLTREIQTIFDPKFASGTKRHLVYSSLCS